MNLGRSDEYRSIETVDHHTGQRPFGIYHIDIPADETNALYLHCHTEAEIFLLKSGTVDFTVEQVTYRLQASDAIFIPPMFLHGAYKEAGGACSFLAIVFSVDIIADYFQATVYTAAIRSAMADCVYPIYRSQERNRRLLDALSLLPCGEMRDIHACELAVTGTIFIVWQELFNLCFRRVTDGMRAEEQGELEKALDFIREHYGETVTLARLAAICGFSEGYFGHLFTDVMGMSPFSYLNKVRVAQACRLLSDTDKKITEIAALTGFNNLSYFNRVFLKRVGMTPSAFRSAKAAYDSNPTSRDSGSA